MGVADEGCVWGCVYMWVCVLGGGEAWLSWLIKAIPKGSFLREARLGRDQSFRVPSACMTLWQLKARTSSNQGAIPAAHPPLQTLVFRSISACPLRVLGMGEGTKWGPMVAILALLVQASLLRGSQDTGEGLGTMPCTPDTSGHCFCPGIVWGLQGGEAVGGPQIWYCGFLSLVMTKTVP